MTMQEEKRQINYKDCETQSRAEFNVPDNDPDSSDGPIGRPLVIGCGVGMLIWLTIFYVGCKVARIICQIVQ